MAGYLISRITSALVVIIGVCILVFLLIHLVPGDPVELMLGESASPADRQLLRASLGLDQPLHRQLSRFAWGLVHLDLGQSLHFHRPVADLLGERIPATAELAAAALLLAIAIAFPLGMIAARYRGGAPDTGAMLFSLLGLSLPSFWLGPMLILVLALWMGWVPVSGRGAPGSLILPALTLGTTLAAVLARMVRSSLLEVLGEDFVRVAHAKGLSPVAILARHALPNAALPLVTLLGLQMGALLGGAVITETVFAWPGLGGLLVEAIQGRDYPLVQGCVLLISLCYVGINLSTDLAYAWLDPRIRLSV